MDSYLISIGLDPNMILLLDGGIMVIVVILMMLSKTIFGIIRESPGLFGITAFLILGFWPWIILWAFMEASEEYHRKREQALEKENKTETDEKTDKKEYI